MAAGGHSADGVARRGLMFVLSSPSGAGKTTLSRMLMEKVRGLQMSVSVTTRPMRPGEVEGRDYFFIDQKRFDEMAANGDLLEWAATVLDITIEIVTRPADQVGFQVQPRRWVVEIVFTQMTKTDVFAGRGRGNDIADLHFAIGYDHSVDQEQYQLPFLLKRGSFQAFPDPLAKCVN